MPVIASFDGIIIRMFFNDHPPPHFHIRYGGGRAIMTVAEAQLLAARHFAPGGSLGTRESGCAVRNLAARAGWPTAGRDLMPGLTRNLIRQALPDPITLTVHLTWENGSETRADFATLAGRGLLAAFTDPKFFESARITDDGHVLAWPGKLEFDADALWFEAHPEDEPNSPMINA